LGQYTVRCAGQPGCEHDTAAEPAHAPALSRPPARRDRYNAAHRRAWRPGDRFRMLWEFPDQPDLRVWYFGAVLQRVPRKRADPRRDSPWEALQVAWDTGEVTCVSCWEIERHHECAPCTPPQGSEKNPSGGTLECCCTGAWDPACFAKARPRALLAWRVMQRRDARGSTYACAAAHGQLLPPMHGRQGAAVRPGRWRPQAVVARALAEPG